MLVFVCCLFMHLALSVCVCVHVCVCVCVCVCVHVCVCVCVFVGMWLCLILKVCIMLLGFFVRNVDEALQQYSENEIETLVKEFVEV